MTSVAEGAAELLVPAVSPETATVSGRYFADLEPTAPSRAARDETAARRLWAVSADLLGVEPPLAATPDGDSA